MPAARVGAASFASNISNPATSITVPYAQAPTAGNYLLLAVMGDNLANAETFSTPAGWNVGPTGTSVNGTQNLGVAMFWKVASGNDTAPTINMTNTSFAIGGVEEWSGITGFDKSSSFVAGTGSGPLTNTLTPAKTKELIWTAQGAYTGNTANPSGVWSGGSAQEALDFLSAQGIFLMFATQIPTSGSAVSPSYSDSTVGAGGANGMGTMAFTTVDSPTATGHVVGTVYPTPTKDAGTVYKLSTTASTATSNTKITVPGLGNTVSVFIPEQTNATNAAIPAAPATLSSGWDLNPLIPYGDAGTLLGGALNCVANLTASASINGATANPTVTFILFVNGTEIARATSPATSIPATTATSFSATISIPQTTLPANAAVQIGVYLTAPTNANVGAATVTLNYASTGTTFTGLAYTIQASRSMTDSLLTSDSVSRRVTVTRSMSDSLPISDSVSRAYTARRSMTDTTSVSDSVSRRYLAVRAMSDTILTSDSASRRYTGARSVTDTILTSDSVSRNIIYARSTMDALTSGGGGTTVVVKKIIAVFDD